MFEDDALDNSFDRVVVGIWSAGAPLVEDNVARLYEATRGSVDEFVSFTVLRKTDEGAAK
jgi:hypothetical protein